MGNSEDRKPSKPERLSAPAMDQNSVHAYPNWAMMQAYYGPPFAAPPYLNSAVASPYPVPPFMWAPPQLMIPPYGAPYAAMYAQGGVYGHPGLSIAGTAFSMDAPVKSLGNKDGGFMKKLKGLDRLAVPSGNGHAKSDEHGTDQLSESEETDDSSDGSNGVTAEAGHSGMKRSRPGSPNSAAGDGKARRKDISIPSAEVGRGSESTIDTSHPANAQATTEDIDTALELKDPSGPIMKPIATTIPQPSIPNEAWLQNEQELKWERRKQANRESARRSRLRKQAEERELVTKVETLATENLTLKSKINELMEISKKLKLENATLMEKLKDVQMEEANFHKIDRPVGTANLLAKVDGTDPRKQTDKDGDSDENRNPVAKLHQLLDVIAVVLAPGMML